MDVVLEGFARSECSLVARTRADERRGSLDDRIRRNRPGDDAPRHHLGTAPDRDGAKNHGAHSNDGALFDCRRANLPCIRMAALPERTVLKEDDITSDARGPADRHAHPVDHHDTRFEVGVPMDVGTVKCVG